MIWRIPVKWEMSGIQEVAAETLAEAMYLAQQEDAFDVKESEFVDDSLKLDCDDEYIVRQVYNNARPDRLEILYPEIKMYYIDADKCFVNLWDKPMLNVVGPGFATYEIVFDIGRDRFYCYIAAGSMDEAIGIFFKAHPHITYEMIVDHVEV